MAYLMGEDASMSEDAHDHQGDGVTVGEALGAFLVTLDHPESRGTHKVYSTTLRALAKHYGADTTVDGMTVTSLSAAFRAQWGTAEPSTSNSRRATVSAWLRYCEDQGWVADAKDLMRGIEHRKTAPDNSRALTRAEIDKLLSNPKVPLRDKTLWRMLYETAARSAEVLRLNVEDLDLPNRRAKVQRKGGAIDVIVWQSGTAQLLPRLLNGRKRGPLFVTERKGKGYSDGRVATRDLTEDGYKRLSYRQAEDDFKAASGGATLHQLRHSALTHDAERGTNTAMLMAKSGHTSVRSLARYARVSAEALQRYQEQTDTGNN